MSTSFSNPDQMYAGKGPLGRFFKSVIGNVSDGIDQFQQNNASYAEDNKPPAVPVRENAPWTVPDGGNTVKSNIIPALTDRIGNALGFHETPDNVPASSPTSKPAVQAAALAQTPTPSAAPAPKAEAPAPSPVAAPAAPLGTVGGQSQADRMADRGLVSNGQGGWVLNPEAQAAKDANAAKVDAERLASQQLVADRISREQEVYGQKMDRQKAQDDMERQKARLESAIEMKAQLLGLGPDDARVQKGLAAADARVQGQAALANAAADNFQKRYTTDTTADTARYGADAGVTGHKLGLEGQKYTADQNRASHEMTAKEAAQSRLAVAQEARLGREHEAEMKQKYTPDVLMQKEAATEAKKQEAFTKGMSDFAAKNPDPEAINEYAKVLQAHLNGDTYEPGQKEKPESGGILGFFKTPGQKATPSRVIPKGQLNNPDPAIVNKLMTKYGGDAAKAREAYNKGER